MIPVRDAEWSEWYEWFAWYPVETVGGGWAWWKEVRVRRRLVGWDFACEGVYGSVPPPLFVWQYEYQYRAHE